MDFFTRYGTKHEGRMHDVNEAKGTALYTYQDVCHRCGGAGQSSKWMFTGLVCFDCRGNGKGKIRTEKLYSAEKLAKLNAAQAKRDAAKMVQAQAAAEIAAREADARRAEFETANPGLIAAIDHAVAVVADPFLADMARRLREVGSLTEKQLAAAQTAVARFQARQTAKAGSQFVGETGKRVELVLTVERVIQLGNDGGSRSYHYARFTPPTIYLCRDSAGNRIVYKGTGSLASKGETVKVKATVAEHNVREDEKQTLISRPKVLGTLDPETGTFMIWSDEVRGMVAVG